jgi:hypothetical protein
LPPRVLGKNRVYLQDLRPHQVDELWGRYREALAPLQESGKLGIVLFQFPPGFSATTENAAYIQSCQAELEGFNLAVEFRNRSWLEAPVKERTPEFLLENGLALVCVDMPQGLDISIPEMAVTTAKDSYVRLHGRNGEDWERPDASLSNLHDYWYTEAELEEWMPRGLQEGPAGGPEDCSMAVAQRERFIATEDPGAFPLGTGVDWLAGTIAVPPDFAVAAEVAFGPQWIQKALLLL